MRTCDNGVYRNMTEQEISELYSFQSVTEKPTDFDKLEAQIVYTAMITGTLLSKGE